MKEKELLDKDNTRVKHKHGLLVIFPVTILSIMGVSSVIPAFPIIKETLNLSAQQVGLLIAALTLPGFLLAPFYGILSDRIGRKKILIAVLTIYGIFGSLAASSVNFKIILLFRLLQGFGHAPLTLLSTTLIADIYSGKRREAVMGYNAGVLGIGTALFPAIGGALAALAWFSPFLLAFLAIPVAFLAIFNLDNDTPEHRISLKEYFISAGKKMLSKYMFGVYASALIVFLVMFGAFLAYIAFLLSDKFQLSSVIIGLTISFMSVSTAIVAAQLGKLLSRFKPLSLLMVSFVLYAVALTLLPFTPIYALIFIPVAIFGIAQGLSVPVIQILIANYASPEQRAVFMSFFSVVMNLGATLGPVLFGIIFAASGFTGTFLSGAAASIIGIVLIAFIPKPKTGKPETASK